MVALTVGTLSRRSHFLSVAHHVLVLVTTFSPSIVPRMRYSVNNTAGQCIVSGSRAVAASRVLRVVGSRCTSTVWHGKLAEAARMFAASLFATLPTHRTGPCPSRTP